jgi:zinc-ribbon domain
MMRCPACGAENPEEAKRCTACGERTARKARRRDPDDADTPFAPRPDSPLAPAMRAYRWGVYSLIPFAGLVLGPLAVVMAVLAWREGRRDPEARSNGYVLAALALGLAALLCNGVGVALIVIGWMGS